MSAAALGTFMVELDTDPSKLGPKFRATTKDATAAAKDIEVALNTNIDRAFRALKRSYDSTWTGIKSGAKGADAAVLRHTKNLELWRSKVEKNAGSIVFATNEEQAQYAELEAQLKRLREEASKQREVSLPKTDTKKIAEVFDTYEAKYSDLQKSVEEGNPQMVEQWKKLVGVQLASIAAVKTKYGEISKATPRETQLLKKQEQQVKTLEARIRAFNAEYRQRTASMNGLPTNMGDALKQIASGYGAIGQAAAAAVGKATIITALAVAAAAAVLKAVKMINSEDTNAQWSSWFAKAKRRGEEIKKLPWEWVANMPRGEFGNPMNAGSARKRTGLFAPPVDPRTGQAIGTQAYRLQANEYRAFADPRLPSLRRLEYQKQQVEGKMTWAGNEPQTKKELERFKELDLEHHEATAAIQGYIRANSQRITQLDLERAQMTNNKKAIADLSNELDRYTAEEMKAAGVATGVIAATMAITKANRALSFTIRDITEEMETLSLQQSLAEFDSDFDAQRELTKQMGQRALVMANLTGKSDEYVAAMKRQVAQQLVAIEIARIQRQQETIDLQAESAQARGNIELQKALAIQSNANAVAIAEKENRTREYIAALVDLGVITQAQLEQERIARNITLSQSLLGLTTLQDELSTTNLYAGAIALLTDKLDKLNIARLRASVDPLDWELADIAQAQLDERPNQHLAQFNMVRIGLDREYAAMHLSIQENLRNAERVANEERIREYRAMNTQYIIDAQQRDVLILQSRKLLDQRLRDVDASYGRDWARWAERLAIKYEDEYSRIGDIVERFADNSKTLLADGLFLAITEGLDSVEDAFKNFGMAILRELTNILASRAMAQFLRFFESRGGGSSNADAVSTVGGIINMSQWHFANGGIAPGGFRAFAAGGIVSRPTLGLIGEGRYDEAVVPLPNGRSIPVEMPRGGRGGGVIENRITLQLTPGFAAGMAPLIRPHVQPTEDEILIPVTAAILDRKPILHVIRNMVNG